MSNGVSDAGLSRTGKPKEARSEFIRAIDPILDLVQNFWLDGSKRGSFCVKTRYQKLFSTIAFDLAGLDWGFKRALAEIVGSDISFTHTDDLTQQWRRLISEPISRIRARGRAVVIVIDALDESGDEATRRRLLSILARDTSDLPANFRILVASRPLPDICSEFKGAKCVVLDNSLSSMIFSYLFKKGIRPAWYDRYISPVLRMLFFMTGLIVSLYFLIYVFGYGRSSW